MQGTVLPNGVLSVLQTPFSPSGGIDYRSLLRLIDHAVESGVDGFLAPAVASEVDFLTRSERTELVGRVAAAVRGRVPFIAGASARDIEEAKTFARIAESAQAAAYLVAVPPSLTSDFPRLRDYLRRIAESVSLPLIIQDLDWTGPGLRAEAIQSLREILPTLAGVKVETHPSGPKYTAVKQLCGRDFFVAGGWAVPQMIEALDRGVDAMIPESSMIPAYSRIYRDHVTGRRDRALTLFRKLLPVLAFANQEIALSIAFFKRLLLRKGIFSSDTVRHPGFTWDRFNERIAEELILYYLELEAEVCSRDSMG